MVAVRTVLSTTRRRLLAFAVVVVVVAAGGIGVAAFAIPRIGGATPSTALAVPHFVDETATSGLDQTYGGPDDYFVGGGVAAFDCNDDGRQDLYIAGGARPAALFRNDSPVGGALRFSPIHDPVTDLLQVTGAYPLDIDGDGIVDLAVLRLGESVLLRGLGDCKFERGNEAWSFHDADGWTTAFSATWQGADAFPTLAFGQYLTIDRAGQPTTDCGMNAIFWPAPSGPGYRPPMPLGPGFCALSMLFSDWDRSGRRDLRISNDQHYYKADVGEEQLFRMEPGQPPRPYTDADGWVPVRIEGMGIASYDVTGDGYPEVYLTSQGANRLQTLAAGPSQPNYRDIGVKRGVEATRPYAGGDPLPSTAWHPEFEDVNNDGFVDLFVSKGNVEAMPDYARKDPSNLLMGQPDGTFVEGGDRAGIVSFARGRGAALADFNLDGLLDLVQVNSGDPVKVWRNVGAGTADAPAQLGSWLGVRATEPGPNRDAIGGWIEVRVGDSTMRRELTVGGGHVSGQLGFTHFGLGHADAADVRVLWPDGQAGPWLHVAANQFTVIDRAASTARPWQMPTR